MHPSLRNLCTATFITLTACSNINAQGWSELGGNNSLQANDIIYSICKDATGNIFAGGGFYHIGGHEYVEKYNGTNWIELGGYESMQANSGMSALISDDTGNIYAAGGFTNASGESYVAKWNTATNTWSSLGGNSLHANQTIDALYMDASGNIYAAGWFKTAFGYCYVAKYNGTGWSELGGANSLQAVAGIFAITGDAAGNIYAAGYFGNASANSYVAKWNHTTNTWSELGGANSLQANSPVYALVSDAAGNIYAAGTFTNANGKNYVAKWDHATNTWSELGGNNSLQANSGIRALCTDASGNVYAAGYFTQNTNHRYVAKWNHGTNTWSALGADSLQANASILSLLSDTAGNIYAAGYFTNANNKEYVAKYTSPADVSILAGNNDICAGTNVTFTATPVNIPPPITYQWKVNGNNVGSNSATYTYAPANNDVVSCVLNATAFTDTSNSIVMQVTPIVIPTVTCSVNPSATVNNGTTVTFSSTITNGGSDPQYQWLKNGQPIAGATSATWTAIAGTSFASGDIISLNLQSSAKCATPDSSISNTFKMTINTTGIHDVQNGVTLSLYPNPNDGTFVLDGTVKESGDYEMVITNTLGQIVYNKTISVKGPQLHKTISVANLASGIYYLKMIKDNGMIIAEKFEKLK